MKYLNIIIENSIANICLKRSPINAFSIDFLNQSLVELPLILSDHADWNELTNYIKISEAENVYVTHGREEAIVHWCKKNNINGLALSLSGREDEEEL